MSPLQRSPRRGNNHLGRRLATGLTLLGLIWAGLTLPSIALASEPRQDSTPPATDTLNAQLERALETYRLWCSTCHGNRGQGLTADWLQTWDPRDRNCWQSKCHSFNHPSDGFILPRYIPAIVGASALGNFSSVGNLNAFIRSTMPYQEPGILSEQDYWDLTAYLLRQNGTSLPSSALGPENAPEVRLSDARLPPAGSPTPTGLPDVTPTVVAHTGSAAPSDAGQPVPVWAFVILIVTLAIPLLAGRSEAPSAES